MGIEAENQEIEKSMRETARNLLQNNEVDVIIGYAKGTIPLSSTPIIIRSVEDVDKLIWNNFCYVNLAKYLTPRMPQLCDSEGKPLRVGIVSKGCTARAIFVLAAEKQVDLDTIKIIGISCNGILNRKRIEKEVGENEILEVSINDDTFSVKGKDFEWSFPYEEYMNELCKVCQVKSPPSKNNACVGSCEEITSIEDDFADIAEFESKSSEKKWAYIKEMLESCTRCYACREACPMCYCNLCFIDQNKPIWFGKTSDISDIILFHLVRSVHLAGRCVACGACSSVCPMGIDLNLITRKLEKIVKERFNYTSGLNHETLPPMTVFKMDDEEEFMLEED
ncbi:MAG: 4Fe-4S ferredoxin [Promethearchaeota archaeon]